MADFDFLKNKTTDKWMISAPRRAKRTNTGNKPAEICPFCLGTEVKEDELYRVGGEAGDADWKIRVIPNKFPFTPHHELVIHSPDHHKNLDELAFAQVELIFETYRQRFNANKKYGHVYIFHNRGHAAGESLPHPHTQLTVIPHELTVTIPNLGSNVIARSNATKQSNGVFETMSRLLRFARNDDKIDDVLETENFLIFCPTTSEWPDEVWVAPKEHGSDFGGSTHAQVKDLAFAVSRLIQIFDLRHGSEFPFNFYIYPGKNWYLRLIPRLKIIGGFELGTQVMVNTQDPKETFAFIKEHFWEPNTEKIKSEHTAEYLRSV